MTDNIVLTTYLKVEVLHDFEYGQLFKYHAVIKNAITELRELKEESVYTGQDKKAVEFNRMLNFAQTNLGAVEVAMMAKEHDACEYGDIDTMWLN